MSNFFDLRSLAQEPPKENAQECLRLMGMALKNLSVAMNNTQALEAAAIILGTSPTQSKEKRSLMYGKRFGSSITGKS